LKALVLAGGTGSRLRPFTHSGAKQLLPIANKPVLFYGLEAMASAGIQDIGIVVSGRGTEIRQAVGDGSAFGLRVTYLQQEQPLGLAHGVLISREFLGDDDFLLYLADTYLQGGVAGFTERAAADHAAARLLLTPVADPSAFGVAELDERGDVLRLEEKPARPRSDLALIGVYAFTPVVHQAVRSIRPSARGELEITHALQWMIGQGMRVGAETTTRPWRDTGSVDDVLEANRQVLDAMEGRVDGKVDQHSTLVGRVSVAEGAVVRGSRIVGPAVIGAGAVISNSSIGPYTSIGEDCRVEDSAIQSSVLLRGAAVEGATRLEASLIGRGAVVAPAPRLPQAHRLVIGDHSKVLLTS
jgi:glucose-1-phosphate thymidylyltransferase